MRAKVVPASTRQPADPRIHRPRRHALHGRVRERRSAGLVACPRADGQHGVWAASDRRCAVRAGAVGRRGGRGRRAGRGRRSSEEMGRPLPLRAVRAQRAVRPCGGQQCQLRERVCCLVILPVVGSRRSRARRRPSEPQRMQLSLRRRRMPV